MHTREGQLLFLLIGATLIVGGLIGYFLLSMLRHFGRYRRLQDGYDQAKLEALEQERQVIAADLHDDIGPLLSASLYKLGEVSAPVAREQQLLQEARSHIEGIFSRLRELSTMLVPRAIEKKGPLYALDEFTETYLAGQPLKVEITPLRCPGLGAYRSLHLFRMLQEILHNTIKHAGARRLTVEARISNDILHIETRDDGRGFDPAAVMEHPGLGLQNLAVRAQMIGARIRTISWPGEGTRYTIDLSLNESTQPHGTDPHTDGR